MKTAGTQTPTKHLPVILMSVLHSASTSVQPLPGNKPEGEPENNQLPTERSDEAIDAIIRLYIPDMEKMKTWQMPKVELIESM